MKGPESTSTGQEVSTPPSAEGATPFMAQYLEMKRNHPDAMLFFRMGDFYELFFDDAILAGRALGITQTFRGQHNGQPIPMAGVPYHAAEGYLARLIKAGYRVAVCEQTEDPAEARKRGSKAVVRREVVRVVTPGTITEESLLEARSANSLAAIGIAGEGARRRWLLPTSRPDASRFSAWRPTFWKTFSRPWGRAKCWWPTVSCLTRTSLVQCRASRSRRVRMPVPMRR